MRAHQTLTCPRWKRDKKKVTFIETPHVVIREGRAREARIQSDVVLSSPSFIAIKEESLGENEEKSLKRTRDGKNPSNTNSSEIQLPLEGERMLKSQKTEQASGAIIKAAHIQMGEIVIPDDVVSAFFFNLPFSSIRSGRCASKQLQRILMSDDFCNYWGIHFSPSTPKAMGMTPQDFIRYWSTLSFRVLSHERYDRIEVVEMSGDGSTLLVFALDSERDNTETMLQQRRMLAASGSGGELAGAYFAFIALKTPCIATFYKAR